MKLFLLLIGGVFAVCTPPTPMHPAPVGQDDIETVCNWLRVNNCEAGKDTPEGATCETVHRNAAQNGIDLVGDPACVTTATSCEAADLCP